MIIIENNKSYTIHLCDSIKNIKFMINWIELYIKKRTKRIIGIDFEFNRVNNAREIALCQLNMEEDNNNPYIFIFYPPDIKTNIFNRLLTSPDIIKILHGGESLDIPYLFSSILVTDKDKYLFSKNLFDTKYMCEYYNAFNNHINYRCRIYDLLLQMNVINKTKYNELEENDRLMGNIWEINLKINRLSKRAVIYCLYDVLFLPALFNSFPKNDIYMKLLPSIGNYNNISRYNDKLNDNFMIVSKYNNTNYKINKDSINYNEIYNIVYVVLESEDIFMYLFQLNYFKKFYEIIIKNILYAKLSNEYKKTVYPQITDDKILQSKELMKFQIKISSIIDTLV
jgi:hypothetical protein